MKTHIRNLQSGGWLLAAVVPCLAFGQANFYGIGDLTGGNTLSQVRAAINTPGGIVATGFSSTNSNPNGNVAVIWSQANGLVALPPLAGGENNTAATGLVTGNDLVRTSGGQIIVASRSWIESASGKREGVLYDATNTAAPFALTAGFGTVGSEGGQRSAANSISADGTVVYGFGLNVDGGLQGLRWTSGTGLVVLPYANVADTEATPSGRAISSDGSVVVGTSGNLTTGLGDVAFRYVHGTGVSSLGFLAAGGTWSAGIAVTADGNTVFGVADSAGHANGELFRWTSGGGMVGLGSPDSGGAFSTLAGVTGDGSVYAGIVGANSYIHNPQGWFEVSGVLTGAGVNLAGWSDFQVTGISSDGTLLFGSGQHNGAMEGFVASFSGGYLQAIPEPSTYALLAGFGAMGLVLCRRLARKIGLRPQALRFASRDGEMAPG